MRKIVTLGEHLSADQDIHFPVLDAVAHFNPRVFTPRAVTIHAHDPGRRKMVRERGLDALRALADRRQRGIPAGGTSSGHAFAMSAMMAMQLARRQMQYELRRAPIAA